jgi:hypothetical protein
MLYLSYFSMKDEILQLTMIHFTWLHDESYRHRLLPFHKSRTSPCKFLINKKPLFTLILISYCSNQPLYAISQLSQHQNYVAISVLLTSELAID